MGITVKELLKTPFFKDCKVIAGSNGLDKQIQGVAIGDAPDGHKWVQGKELVLTSGYPFVENKDLLTKESLEKYFKDISGIMIKWGRYIDHFSEETLLALNKLEVPLIIIEKNCAWMDIMSEINLVVMNKSIERFRIENISPFKLSKIPFQSQKINKILTQLEEEMKFPAMVYHESTKNTYYSSSVFKEISSGLEIEDFWNPKFEYSKEIMCSKLKMERYRYIDKKHEKPFSWITIPVTVSGKLKGYFVVLEATGLIDYFDQISIRVGFLLIQSVFEQMLIANNIDDIKFEQFITEVTAGKLNNKRLIKNKCTDLDIRIDIQYFFVFVKQTNPKLNLRKYRNELKKGFNIMGYLDTRVAFVENNKAIFLISREEDLEENENLEKVIKLIKTMEERIKVKSKATELKFGIADTPFDIEDINRNYEKAEKAANIGYAVYRGKNIFKYSNIGVFAWIDIREDEIDIMTKDFKKLLNSDERKELIETLKIYLETNMNYSITSKRMYTHINTIRNRIRQIKEMINLDLDDPTDRLKTELILRIVE